MDNWDSARGTHKNEIGYISQSFLQRGLAMLISPITSWTSFWGTNPGYRSCCFLGRSGVLRLLSVQGKPVDGYTVHAGSGRGNRVVWASLCYSHVKLKPKWNQPRCSSVDEWIMKMRHTHKIDYSAMKKNKTMEFTGK